MGVDAHGLFQHPEPAPYPFGPKSVADVLIAGLETHPERVALIDGDRSWTWTELDAAVNDAALRFTPGHVVAVEGGNAAETIIDTLATLRAGAVAILSPIRHALFDDVPATRGFPSSIEPGAQAVIAFTSGTSGSPKAVVHSQRNLLCPGLISIDVEPPTPGERIGAALNLQIMNVMVLGPISALLRGTTFVVMQPSKRSSELAFDIERFGVTRLFAVPTQLHDVLEQGIEPRLLTSLDRVIVGGGRGEAELLQRFTTTFGVRPTLSYGLTEAPTGVVRESLDDPIGSGRGFALPHVDVSIRDEVGEVVPVGQAGEICLRPARDGPWAGCWTPALGYLFDPDRTAALFVDGVLHTGDRGMLDEDGALSVLGRLDAMIIRGGMNIDPEGVRQVLLSDPTVADAAVFGIADARLGQRIGAMVVPVAGATIDQGELRQGVRDQLSPQCAPDVIVESSELPRNAMGKFTLPPELLRSLRTTDRA